jgi:hypothetical protein
VSSTVEILTVHEAELVSPRKSGGRIRAYCHIHGGDHQRSLSIALDGDAAGYGYCHTCSAKVFVPELAPEGAQAQRSQRPRRVTAEALLRPARKRAAPSDPTPEPWQRVELAALTQWYPRMRERLADERACAYLEARAVPYDFASGEGVGYIPADAKLAGHMAKWRDRLVFPLGSPAGAGYAGRSLAGWVPGMDENEHKVALESDPDAPRRWEKTYPAGWYGYGSLASAERVVICEGPLDRLALMAAGLPDVVALVGTAARAQWIPASVRGVVLALDGDAAGRERARTLRQELRAAGLEVTIVTPPADDGQGKDWSERWRRAQWDGVLPVVDAWDALAEV